MRFLFVFLLVTSFSKNYAQEIKSIKEIKEEYWIEKKGEMEKTYLDSKFHHFKPIYESFVYGRELFYPSYFYGGNYQTIYKYSNRILTECDVINYSKNPQTINFEYDNENRLLSVYSPTRKINYSYNNNKILITAPQDYQAEIFITNGKVYEFKSGKTAHQFYYHYSDSVEAIVPNDQVKIIYEYDNDRIIKITIIENGEKSENINIDYKNDNAGNWTTKTLEYNNKKYIVTREITY